MASFKIFVFNIYFVMKI